MKSGARVMTLQCSGEGGLFGTVLDVGLSVADVFFRGYGKQAVPLKNLAEVPKPLTPAVWRAMPEQDQRAYVQEKGIRVHCTTFIDDETFTYGFGEEEDGAFTYPCPWYKPTPSPSPESHG